MKSEKSLLIKNSSQYFGVEPQEIVLFEDSPNTINLAKSLGCETVYVYNGENLPECNYDTKIDVRNGKRNT